MANPTVSVVIVTLNRADAIGLLLEELVYQDYDLFEVVVVVGPCIDDTKSILSPFHQFIKIVDCDSSNISVSRNIGIEHASGEIIIFIDDDAYPAEKSWISDYVKSLTKASSPKIGISGGPVFIENGTYYEFQRGLFDRSGFQIFENENQNEKQNQRWKTRVAGGNNASWKKTIIDIGGYDEHIAYYLDETDLCMLLHQNGLSVQNEDIPIRHYRLPNSTRKGAILVNRKLIAKSDVYFTIKHSSLPRLFGLIKAWCLLPQKHYFKEIIFQGSRYRLNFKQQTFSLLSVIWGASLGSFSGLFPGKPTTLKNKNTPFQPLKKGQLKALSNEHLLFVNNEMGKGGTTFKTNKDPIQQLQIYWSDNGHFSEDNCETMEYPIGKKSKLICSFPPDSDISYLRIDPARMPVSCKIEKIICYDKDNNAVYNWTNFNDPTIKEISGIEIEHSSPKNQITTVNNDPWFILNSNNKFGNPSSCCIILKTEITPI